MAKSLKSNIQKESEALGKLINAQLFNRYSKAHIQAAIEVIKLRKSLK